MNIGYQYEQNSLMNKIKLNLDFTRLAKVAYEMNKVKVSEYLIQHEKQIVKKIPFLLEIKQFQQALAIAVDAVDPNNINRVLTETLKQVTDLGTVILMAFNVPDGLRHLRNFAKKRRKLEILRAISDFTSTKRPDEILHTGVRSDYSEVTELLKQAYEAENL